MTRISKKQRLVGAVSLMGAMTMAAIGAIDSTVPADWNTTPFTAGAYIETFENGYKNWMTNNAPENEIVLNTKINEEFNGGTALKDNSAPRTNDWFGTSTKALQLDTEGAVVTNKLGIESGTEYLDTTTAKPVYVDMLVRFDPLSDGGDPAMFDGSKMALYVSEAGNLVLKANDGTSTACFTNSATLATNEWNRITIKMMGDTFEVLKNDVVLTFGSRTEFYVIPSVGASSQIAQTSFCGTGHLDDLYVSYGDPTYAVLGASSAAAVTLDATTSLSVTNITQINKWLADNKTTITTAAVGSTVAENKAIKAFLLNDPAAFAKASSGADLNYTLGISAIDVLSDTQVKVTVALKVADGAKVGTINGYLRLEGKQKASDAYTDLTKTLGATVISNASFTNGSAEFTFTIPSGYHIFNPIISLE